MEQQSMVVLDMEGVLIPEIWIAVAERTGVEALRRTTRDEPDYDALMRYRLDLLGEHGLTMSVIAEVIAGLDPLPGAVDFLAELRSRRPVVILSDTFEQFAAALAPKLGYPVILCHRLEVDEASDRVTGYRLRIPDQKQAAVEAFRALGYRVLAAGDSYNDTSMLLAASSGYLFNAPPNVVADFPQLEPVDDFDHLLHRLLA
jgi:phosphoserine/homoserine phosphotransferase